MTHRKVPSYMYYDWDMKMYHLDIQQMKFERSLTFKTLKLIVAILIYGTVIPAIILNRASKKHISALAVTSLAASAIVYA